MSVLNEWSGDAKVDTFVIKAGDRLPVLGLYLKYADGTARNLTSHTAKLRVAPIVGGRRLVDDAAMLIPANNPDPTAGYVEYAWPANLLIAGEYLMEVLVYDNSTPPKQESFPKGSYYKLVIIPHL